MDHGLYALDNEVLGSTDRAHARIQHQVSWQTEIPMASVVEFEHAFALVGHTDDRTDLARFREELPDRFGRFAAWVRSGPHRLVAATEGAAASLAEILRRTGHQLPPDRVSVVRWAARKRRGPREPHARRLKVFHYGGAFPLTKGTHDVIEVARRLRGISFTVSVDPGHPLVAACPANVRVVPYRDKGAYDAELASADLVLHPVYADGWGVVLDALSLAVPLVVYDTYDKREAVEDGLSGRLVAVPGFLSWYDGFFAGPYRTWAEYSDFLDAERSADRADRLDRLAACVAAYDRDRDLLARHSEASSRRFDERHAAAVRIPRIQAIYREILAELNG